MARKRKSQRKDRRTKRKETRDEYGITRKIGSFLTLVAVSVITVVLGFAIGRYVIVNLIADTLGLETTAQTAPRSRVTQTNPGPTSTQVTVNTLTDSGGSTQSSGTTSTAGASGTQAPPSTSQAASSQTSVTASGSQAASGGSSSGTQAAPSSAPTAQTAAQAPATSSAPSAASGKVLYRVQVGGYADRASADQLLSALKGRFPDAYVTFGSDFRVQVGAFSTAEGANELADDLRAQGYTVHIVPINL